MNKSSFPSFFLVIGFGWQSLWSYFNQGWLKYAEIAHGRYRPLRHYYKLQVLIDWLSTPSSQESCSNFFIADHFYSTFFSPVVRETVSERVWFQFPLLSCLPYRVQIHTHLVLSLALMLTFPLFFPEPFSCPKITQGVQDVLHILEHC